MRSGAIFRQHVLCGFATCLGVLAFVTSAAAQSATSGITGKVSDTTGGALPGVTATITSPSLQVPSMSTVSEADGAYRFVQLPAGTYAVKYELTGFKTSVRQGVVLAVGFVATISPSLEVGGLEETIIVSGASPVVDSTNNTVTSRLSPEELAALPSGRRHNDVAMMTPGMMLSTMPVVTAVGLASLSNNVSSSGLSNLSTNSTGVYYRTASDGIEHNSGGVRSPDYTNVEEVNITQSGGTADIAQAGIYVNIVSKSGGNDLHGRYAIIGTGHALEGKNVDSKLRSQGITATSGTDWFYDANADLGGRIVRDRLWYYGSIRRRANKYAPFGVILSPGPDRIYGTADDTYYHPQAKSTIVDGKISYQPSSKWNLSYYLNNEHNYDTGGLAGRFVPYQASAVFRYSPTVMKGDVKATLTNNLLLTGTVGRDWAPGGVDYYAQPGTENLPATLNLATQYRLGRAFPLDRRQRSKWTTKAEMTYLPTGSLLGLGGRHELKVGTRTWSAYVDTFHANDPTGNYILIFDTISGVQNTPSQIRTYNSPVTPHAVAENQSAYVTDRVTLGALTLNLGIRWDRYHAYVPQAVKPQGPFGTSGTFPPVDAGTWNTPAPRAGFAYNLTKDAKTVIKGTYGWFNDDMLEIYANDYNQNVDVVTTYRWHDLGHCTCYTPGEVNLDVNGPDFLTQVGAPSNISNPKVKYEHIHQLTGSFERELMQGMALRFLYTYNRYADEYTGLNVLRPYSAYNIPLTRIDPGPTGVLGGPGGGKAVTIWDFDPAYAGARFQGTEKLNVPRNRTDRYHSFELTLNKRFSQKWEATASGSLVKNHQWLTTPVSAVTNTTLNNISAALPQSPNEDYYPVNDTLDWAYRTTVSYVLPFEIRAASLAFFENGVPGQRTYIFRAADPLGGPPLRQQANVTLRLDPFGTERGPVRKVINFRLSKILRFAHGRKAEAYVDFDNIINSNAAWSSTYQSGLTFGFTTLPMNPRIIQLGGSFEF